MVSTEQKTKILFPKNTTDSKKAREKFSPENFFSGEINSPGSQ